MSILNKIKYELLILLLLTVSIFFSFDTDFWFYSYFLDINKSFNGVFLKEFFIDITKLGSSSWYFAISFIGFIVFYLNNKLQIIKFKKSNKLVNFFIASFFYILTVGVITQILKHIIGRPRPNYTDFENTFEFNYFTFESGFHSFPSGHSSTIFIVCFIMIAAFPKLKYFFYILATIVALSRVVVGAHFFTDIVAGAVLALILFKVLNILFEKKYNHYKFSNLVSEKNSEIYYYILFLFISCLFITASPSLDLYISSLFYLGDSQFLVNTHYYISIFFREVLLPFILLYILVLPVVGRFTKIDNIFFNYKFNVKEIFLLWGSQVIIVLIFVNFVLKNFWGRARPNDVLELGGKEIFSPWYEMSNTCLTNCSFVSGDASVGFSIIILYLITKKIIFLYASIISGFLLGLIRIVAGGHFLSDIFFAGFFIVILNIILFELYKKYYVK
ncbi:phosphatase PAP2 family protein [Pelagibacteraceae bacterium]|nr:phosphatase PAP2 family protein [Pelagibacteraceae bacterium]